MTMKLDIVTNDAGEGVRREHARELGAGVVVALYRLVKLAQLHDLANVAFTRQLEQTHQIIGDYCLRSGSNLNVMFAKRAVFVAGQLLKGSRGTYEAAAELGDILERFGGSEFSIDRGITREELFAFAEQVSGAHRGQSFRSPSAKIRLRRVADSARLRGLELEELSEEQRIVRMYASAVVIMRRFFEDLAAGRYVLPRRIKRIAQSLVDLGSGSAPAFLGVIEVRNANFDDAGRAVNTAILAVAMAREVSNARSTLAQIAMAAMMHDVARPRAMAQAGSIPGMPAPSSLSEDQEDRLAFGAAAVLTAVGRVNEPTITRTVLAFEAQWLRRQKWLGPLYWGARGPTLHATTIAVARRYNDLLTPEPGLEPRTPDEAVAVLSEELKGAQERSVLRMLVSSLGLLPKGTTVQLTTGETAEVVRGPKGHGDSVRVVLLTDPHGKQVQAAEVELAANSRRAVARVISVDGWRKGSSTAHSAFDAPANERGRSLPEDMGTTTSTGPSAHDLAAIRASSASLPSIGSSPSSVAAAMGRVSPLPPTIGVERVTHRPTRTSPDPTARGNVAATPLPHILVYMLEHGLSGSVVFDTDGGEDIIYFVHGVPTKVRLRETVARLGEVLVHGGALDSDSVEALVQDARTDGALFGRYLVNRNIVSREALDWALEAQLLSKVAYLANLPTSTTYAFYRDLDQLAFWGEEVRTGCALNPIVASVRNWSDRVRVRATLTRIGKHPLALHSDAALENLALLPDETLTLDMIRATSPPLAALLEQGTADSESIASLVYSLAVTRQFSFKGQAKRPMASKSTTVFAPGAPAPEANMVPPSGEPSASGTRPAKTPTSAPGTSTSRTSSPPARSEGGGSAHKMMPAARPLASSKGPQIRRVAVRKATMVGLQAASIAEQRETSGRGHGRESSTPVRSRSAPPAPPMVQTPPDGALTVSRRSSVAAEIGEAGLADVEMALEAMQSYRLAQAALQHNDIGNARTLAEQAVARDPTQGEYIALLAWVKALNDASVIEEAIATMSTVLGDDPSNEQARFYRGKLLVRSNRPKEAVQDFSELLLANPQNQEAQSELRALKRLTEDSPE